MGPEQKRSLRVNQLRVLFLRVYRETKNPQAAYDTMADKAYSMASKPTAVDYINEVVRLVRK
jgi:hypothetical protein